jgi:hypothetical protein
VSIRRKPKKRSLEFRPSSVHQHREPSTIKPSARELWPTVRARLLSSRPILEPSRVIEFKHEHPYTLIDKKTGAEVHKVSTYTQRVVRPPVFGVPTFRNVIEDGVLR